MPIPQWTRITIARDLRARVSAGHWPAGGQLPPAQQLADEYGVSLGTMRWVLDQLQAQGVLVSRQGVGWFVAD